MNIQTFPISTPIPLNPSFKVLFASATKSASSTEGILPYTSLSTGIRIPGDILVDFCAVTDNTDGLPKVCNKVLESNCGGYDCIVFAHDDLEILDHRIFRLLRSSRDGGMDIVGVAGGNGWEFPTGVADPLKTPVGWTTAARRCGMSGFVVHEHEGLEFATNYGNSPARTLTLDGCFMAFMNEGLKLRFDERFDFHFYDMDICMEAYRRGMKVGTAPIAVLHHSIGDGICSQSFLDMQQRFLCKWFD